MHARVRDHSESRRRIRRTSSQSTVCLPSHRTFVRRTPSQQPTIYLLSSFLYQVKPRRGAALLFYSYLPNGNYDDRLDHGACPVRSGDVDKIVGQACNGACAARVRRSAHVKSRVMCVMYAGGNLSWLATGVRSFIVRVALVAGCAVGSFGSIPSRLSRSRSSPRTATRSMPSIARTSTAIVETSARATTSS